MALEKAGGDSTIKSTITAVRQLTTQITTTSLQNGKEVQFERKSGEIEWLRLLA